MGFLRCIDELGDPRLLEASPRPFELRQQAVSQVSAVMMPVPSET